MIYLNGCNIIETLNVPHLLRNLENIYNNDEMKHFTFSRKHKSV